jgi:hypothetical protein
MCQWGTAFVRNGATFLPLFDTPPFQPIGLHDKVVRVELVDDGGDPELAARTLVEMKVNQ